MELRKNKTGYVAADARIDVEQKAESRLGELLVEKGLLALAALQECLAIQQRTKRMGVHRKLGEILVMKGILRYEQVMAALRGQLRARQGAPQAPSVAAGKRPKKFHPGWIAVAAALAVGAFVVTRAGRKDTGKEPVSKETAPHPPTRESPPRQDPLAKIAQDRAEAERAAQEFRFPEAIATYEKLLHELPQDSDRTSPSTEFTLSEAPIEDRGRVEGLRAGFQTRLQLLRAESRAMKLLVDGVNWVKEKPIEFRFANGARRILREADATELKMEFPESGRKKKDVLDHDRAGGHREASGTHRL